MKKTIKRIRENKIKCKKCGDIIESTHVHDFKWCSCKSVAVDGGHEYLRRLGSIEDYEDLSYSVELVEINTKRFEVINNALTKQEDNGLCPMCHSNNVTYQKRAGEHIIGDDIIAIVCHDCEKIFEFIDVNYQL